MTSTNSPLSDAKQPDIVRHIEVKAYLDNYHSLCSRVSAIADSAPIDRVQHDTFFHCRSGRLKLRSSGLYHDLIYYRRKDDYGPSESFYQFARTQHPAALRTSLQSAFGEAGRVKKFRRTYKIGQTMVHLDRVGGLGDFIEIKTELNPAAVTSARMASSEADTTADSLSIEQGTCRVNQLMEVLDVDLFQLVDGAYIDLINEKNSTPIA